MSSENKDYQDVNFVGLPGNTHNFSALSAGNMASMNSANLIASPRKALQQALDMSLQLNDLGLHQAVLPPQERPHIPTLRQLGFSGSDEEVLLSAYKFDPQLVAKVSSASAMWAANAATIIPSCDSEDGNLHIIPANLAANLHRSLEAGTNKDLFEIIFKTLENVRIHAPLPCHTDLGDEGAANHMRFANNSEERGVHLFAYGQSDRATVIPSKFKARQTLRASESLARMGRLSDDQIIYVQQNPEAIDSGVFHNDVINVNALNVWLMHEFAFIDPKQVIDDVKSKLRGDLSVVMAKTADFPIKDLINSYAFNSQLVTLPNGEMQIIAPKSAADNEYARQYLEGAIASNDTPITQIKYCDLDESLKNGGGPACLRLRITLSKEERGNVNGRIFLDEKLHSKLMDWGNRNYRDTLSKTDLGDPELLRETYTALDELTDILDLGSVYTFQKDNS